MATKKKTALSQVKTRGKTQSVQIEDVVASFVEVMMLLGAKRSEILNVVTKAKQARLPKAVTIVEGSLSYWGPVLARWADDPLFIDAQGRPKDLPFEAEKSASFSRLVELELPGEDPKYCRDVLISIDSIAGLPSGALRWLQRDLVTSRNSTNALCAGEYLMPINELLSSLKAGLTETTLGNKTGSIQRSVNGFELHPGDIEGFRGLFNRHGMDFLRTMDDWLTQRTKSRKNSRSNHNHVRPYVGLFMTMEPIQKVAKAVPSRARTR